MSLISELANHFEKNEWVWRLKQNKVRVPDEWDLEQALDEAARMLYDEPVGAQLEVGRLIIRKTHSGHDVYGFFGTYE